MARGLTKKQQAFAQALADGLPALEAYRLAYATQGNKNTQQAEAYRLSRLPKVKARVEAIKAGQTLLKDQLEPMPTLDSWLVELASKSFDLELDPSLLEMPDLDLSLLELPDLDSWFVELASKSFEVQP